MNWFKKKRVASQETDTISAESLHGIVRTKEDDLAGREIPRELPHKTEPLVSFHPEAASSGAPFYAASGSSDPQSESVETTETLEESPVLRNMEPMPPESLPVTEEVGKFSEPVPKVASPQSFMVDGARRSASAFLPASPQEKPEEVVENDSHQEEMPQNEVSVSGDSPNRLVQFLSTHRKTIIFSAVLLFIFGSLGVWWFFFRTSTVIKNETMGDNTSGTMESPLQPDSGSEVTLQGEPGGTSTQYSADQPNVLSLNTETVTADDIRNLLLQTGQSLIQDHMNGPVEFIIKDQRLNPLALSRFAFLSKMNLPSSLLASLDESFSIYLYIDNGRPRTVLLASLKDETIFSAQLKEHERSLGTSMNPLFLDVTTAPKGILIFHDGKYYDRPIRYSNIDESLPLSLDYAIRGKQWLVGTSKNSLRAVLDRLKL